MASEFGRSVEALRGGTISFEQFAASTRGAWRGMARRFLRRWEAPSGVAADDLEQEMLLAAWEATRNYDPTRGGMSVAGFVVFVACHKAKRWLHKQRAAYKYQDGSPSRHPRLVADPENDLPSFCVALAAAQEQGLDWNDRLPEALGWCETALERDVVSALHAEPCFDSAAARLYSDPGKRLAYEWCSGRAALGPVRAAARAVATRRVETRVSTG